MGRLHNPFGERRRKKSLTFPFRVSQSQPTTATSDAENEFYCLRNRRGLSTGVPSNYTMRRAKLRESPRPCPTKSSRLTKMIIIVPGSLLLQTVSTFRSFWVNINLCPFCGGHVLEGAFLRKRKATNKNPSIFQRPPGIITSCGQSLDLLLPWWWWLGSASSTSTLRQSA